MLRLYGRSINTLMARKGASIIHGPYSGCSVDGNLLFTKSRFILAAPVLTITGTNGAGASAAASDPNSRLWGSFFEFDDRQKEI